MTTHYMKLNPAPFTAIQTGAKTIELRLNDEKRQLVCVGDEIVFSNTDAPDEKLTTRVVELLHEPSFAELFAKIDLTVCGFSQGISVEAAVREMRGYYSQENEEKYGALGIKITRKNQTKEL